MLLGIHRFDLKLVVSQPTEPSYSMVGCVDTGVGELVEESRGDALTVPKVLNNPTRNLIILSCILDPTITNHVEVRPKVPIPRLFVLAPWVE
jgi:hypothetical protein